MKEAGSAQKRYSAFLAAAKAEFSAKGAGANAYSVDGFELSGDELNERVQEALDRVAKSKVDAKKNTTLLKRINIRQDLFRKNMRELMKYRATLVEKAEDVQVNEILGEVKDIAEVVGGLKDIEINVSSGFTLDEMTADGNEDGRLEGAKNFLKN